VPQKAIKHKGLDWRGMYDAWEKMIIADIFVGQTRGKRPL